MTATVCRYTNNRILQADLRDTLAANRRLAMLPPTTCWEFGGWLVWPFAYNSGFATTRIRKMCTTAVIMPCCWWDASGWHADSEQYARLDTYKPHMGHEPSVVGGGGSFFPPSVSLRLPTDPVGLPAEWPWADVCNNCWNYSSPFWFEGTAPNDWNLEDNALQLLELMQSTDSNRRKRKIGPPGTPPYEDAPAMDWDCFADQVAPGAICSMAMQIEVYRQQDKATRAYGDLVNIWCHGKISVRVPLIPAP